MNVIVLGSGSGGNATLVECHDPARHRPRRLLIDAGLSPRATARRLSEFRVRLDQIDDLLITHLDHDHFRRTWAKACVKNHIRVNLCRRHYRRSPLHRELGDRMRPFDHDSPFTVQDSITVTPVFLAHDDLGSVGYVIEHNGSRIGFATDLGRVPEHLYDSFVDLDLLAIESNYDREMQLMSSRPPSLKRRIMGGAGHLSNDQCLAAIVRIAQRSRLRHIVLLHLSRQCNHPERIESLYAHEAPMLLPHLTISDQFDPTPRLSTREGCCVESGSLPPVRGRAVQQTLWAM